jgi:YHS domain-containing protein
MDVRLLDLVLVKTIPQYVTTMEKTTISAVMVVQKIFANSPKNYLREIKNNVVCPTCLGEKSIKHTVNLSHNGTSYYFCRCPHCISEFNKNPEYFIKRISAL